MHSFEQWQHNKGLFNYNFVIIPHELIQQVGAWKNSNFKSLNCLKSFPWFLKPLMHLLFVPKH
jgi:hypothetical protein